MALKAITTLLIILFINACHQCQAKNILCLLGVQTEAAEKWNKVLLTELASKGHELTIITPSLWDDDDLPNINFIHLENTKKILKQRYENDNVQSLLEKSTWKLMVKWYDQEMATCRANLESVGFSEALDLGLKKPHSFDLIIYDLTYGPGCLLHLVYLFENIPIVGITSASLMENILKINQNGILNPALDPYILSDFTTNMNYWQRLYNTALYGFDKSYRQWVVEPVIVGLWAHNIHAKNIFVPNSLDELLSRFKVILANYHPALHSLTTLPANVVPVPGLHILNQPTSSNSISSFIENKLDVIFIDLNSKTLGQHNINAILDAISKTSNYGFIWNIGENNKLQQNKPTNVLIGNDFKSGDILAHDNIKAVLTIPETLNLQESLYYGKPIITVTLRPEQRYIAKRIGEQGFGITLELNNFNAETLAQSFKACLEDTKLHISARQIQQSFRNQQNPPLQTAVWWVEHIMQNPHANDHLLPMHQETLGFFARNSLDVIFLIEIFILICIVNTIIVAKQTIENFKKVAKAKRKEAKTKDAKTLKVKTSKKTKTKTS